MDLFDAINERYSYRGVFKKEAVCQSDLVKITKAGMAAPSGKNAQTTEFVIIDDGVIINKINSMSNANRAVASARAYICCIIDKEPKDIFDKYSFQLEDCAAAVENMLLAITSLGYASVWIDGWLRVKNRAEFIAEMIDLPSEKKIQVMLPIGMPEEEVARVEKKEFSQRVFVNGYEKNKN